MELRSVSNPESTVSACADLTLLGVCTPIGYLVPEFTLCVGLNCLGPNGSRRWGLVVPLLALDGSVVEGDEAFMELMIRVRVGGGHFGGLKLSESSAPSLSLSGRSLSSSPSNSEPL